jgi:polysaccharide biosynthesis transport protein
MTGSHLQPVPAGDAPIQPYTEPAPQWDEGGVEPPNKGAQQLQRYAAAVWRFKWLVLLMGILGGVGGTFATGLIDPEYEVQSVVLLSRDERNAARNSPTDGLQQNALLDLLVAYQVVDPVVTRLSLFLNRAPEDSTLFRGFAIQGGSVVPGAYSLRIDGDQFELVKDGVQVVDRGSLGGAIGTSLGFEWTPAAEQLRARKLVEFTVRTPREASKELIGKLRVPPLRQGSNILTLRLTGTDAKRTEATLNAWTESFVSVATGFKKYGVTQRAAILEGQLEYAREQLSDAERSLEGFKVSTAMLPSESRIASVAGQELTANPIYASFFNQQIAAEQLRRDREWIDRALTAGTDGGVSAEALLSIPSVNTEEAAAQLRANLNEALTLESEIRKLELTYTDEAPQLRRPRGELVRLRTEVIPQTARALQAQLALRGSDVETQLDAQRRDLRDMPTRTIELARREREVAVADLQYRSLMAQAQDAKLAEVTTSGDISVLDPAVAPLNPTKNTGPVIIAGSIAAAIGLALLIAIMLDLLDKRFRYPQQATDELGLFILGVIPAINRKRRQRAEDAAQMVEAFRTIRMNMRYAVDPSRPFAVTISSPGPNDGKSLVSSNLALSFADGGARVVLVDGDIRRGSLEETFKTSAKPGLVDYLDGAALLPEVLRGTHHPNLTLIPCGKRQRRGPELLTGPRLSQLVAQLQRDYDVVIIDSPPLGAGSDAYALGIAAEHMVIVLRAGLTDRKMAQAKLRTLETLPVRVLGGVLNGIEMTGQYQYYSYYLDYEARDEDQQVKSLPTKPSSGSVVRAAGD